MLVYIFKFLLITSLIGTAATLVLALLIPFTRKFFSSTWHYYMWLVVLAVMIFPIRISLPEQTPAISEIEAVDVSNEETVINNEVQQAEQDIELNTEQVYITENSTDKLSVFSQEKIYVISIIWLFGVIILFVIKLMGYILFLSRLHSCSSVTYSIDLSKYTDKKIVVRTSEKISSPLITGVFKPTLLLPETAMDEEQLDNVLAHEMTHFLRKDIVYKWFVSIVKCIHWFNPAVYYISKQVDMECEISCDLAVVNGMSEEQEAKYISTILALISAGNRRVAALTTGMTGNKKTLKRRFMMIKNKINISKKAKFISLVLAVILCIGTILASGIINGKFNTSDDILINLNTDERQGNEFNSLMIGVDNNNRIDIILALNFDGNTLTCMNVPRNIALAIGDDVPADNSSKTLSDLLSEENGDQKVINSIKETLGIPVHYYAKVKIDAIAEIVDYVGGIEFEVPYNMAYDDPAQDLYIDLKEGKQVLNGKQVEHLLRFRDRRHPNADEVRVMTWHSVIKEFLNQAIIGNKISNFAALYDIATNNIKTNYPLDDFTKDFNCIKNINRNNIVIKNIRGRNIALNGYFVFHTNYVESKPILDVFTSISEGTNLISTITYTNDILGFSIKMPESWKSKYEIIQFDNQVAFFYKDIFLKYGKGSGNLFRITKVKQPSEKFLEETGAPYEYLYYGDEYAYVWSVASDVQYPTWQDRDEEDIHLATDFENMMMDLNFIKNSFSIVDEESLFTPIKQVSVTDKIEESKSE